MLNEIQTMQAYIERSNIPVPLCARYDAKNSEVDALYRMFHYDPFWALGLAFLYGRAKGYRAAKAEVKTANVTAKHKTSYVKSDGVTT